MIVKGLFSGRRAGGKHARGGGKVVLVAFIVTAFIQPCARAGLGDLPVGARSLGMAGAYVALANTADAVFLNPGGLGRLHTVEASLFYQKPFGLADVDFGTVSITFPVLGYRIGVGLLNIGNSLYKEQWLALAFAHHVRQKLFYGIAFNYQRLDINSYGSGGSFGLDAGFVLPIKDNLTVGFLAKNLNRAKIGKSDDRLPRSFKAGFSVAPAAKTLLNLEFFKEERFSGEFRFGFELQPLTQLALRAGTANNPSRFSAGFGVKLRQFTVDYAFFTHNDLGLTHQISLTARLGAGTPASPPEPPTISDRRAQLTAHSASTNSPSNATVNINTATKVELISLPGIGEKLAQAIIAYREANGLFLRKQDLRNVPGIGEHKYNKIKDRVTMKGISEKK